MESEFRGQQSKWNLQLWYAHQEASETYSNKTLHSRGKHQVQWTHYDTPLNT